MALLSASVFVLHYILVFVQVVVCGLLRDGKVNFHPNDDEKLMETDKLLFIAPLNWKKKQLTDIKAEDITVDEHDTRKQVFEKKRSRLAKIIMRPRKSLSKVWLPTSQTLQACLNYFLRLFISMDYTGIRFSQRSQGIYTFTWLARRCCAYG